MALDGIDGSHSNREIIMAEIYDKFTDRELQESQVSFLREIELNSRDTRTYCRFIFWNTMVMIFLLVAIWGEWDFL